jgi:molecular chaperone HtpG
MLDIPARFLELLHKDQELASFVLGAAAVIAPWARDNKTVFFPEYTDHSLVHLHEVLAASDSLITDDSWPHLTSQDAAVVVTSGMLHDCALHISEDGFYALINGSFQSKSSRYAPTEKPWPLLWQEFLAEARRYNQAKLRLLFDDTQPVTNIPDSKLSLTLRHRLLIGEFLRKYHARLAHEIALAGIPGADGAQVPIGKGNKEFLDLSGFVARSHNMNLRTAVEAIDANKRRVHLNCHVPFAMALLRIADFIQIHSARAHGQLLQLKSLVSPISRGEWKKHGSIMEINQAHDDPEALYVDAEPSDVSSFLSLRNLFKDIQSELDQSWAVLGEVYGRFNPLNVLGINIRRIRSSLDDSGEFYRNKKPHYIPRDFHFRAASAELMDLLVAPLYGSKPEIGVRELVQNAVDACLERDDLVARTGITLGKAMADDVVVTLRIEKNVEAKLIVEDYGVGMTVDVVDNYLLNIGASFRSSDVWRKNHETNGHSTVNRTGRFGIGLLAAFLLGDELKVTTSDIANKNGEALEFVCRRGDETIEVRPTTFHHGTRIEIPLRRGIAEELQAHASHWDWFCLDGPRVIRKIVEATERILTQEITVPSCDASIESTEWNRLTTEEFEDVLWRYEREAAEYSYSSNSILVCNGVFVTRSLHPDPAVSTELDVIRVRCPTLNVFDADGRFPLDLQRTKLASKDWPFAERLAEGTSLHVAKQLADLFRGMPSEFTLKRVKLSVDPQISGLRIGWGRAALAPIILSHDGVLPADLSLIRMMRPTSILVDATDLANGRGAWTSKAVGDMLDYYIACDRVTATKSSRRDFLREAIGIADYTGETGGFLSKLPIVGRRILLKKSDERELVSAGNVPKTQWAKLRQEAESEQWSSWTVGAVSAMSFDMGKCCPVMQSSGAFGFVVLFLDWNKESKASQNSPSPFAKAWLSFVDGAILR